MLDFAERVLGPCQLLADCSWGHAMSSVLRLRDPRGGTWFLKRHGDPARYRSELTAYRSWVPALRDAAPRLRAFDDSLPAIIVSAVPGAAAPWPSPTASGPRPCHAAERAVQRQAGSILRSLHDAQAPAAWPDFAAEKLAQFDRLSPAAEALLDSRTARRCRARVAALARLAPPARVPCHRDYTPRNWLVHRGTLRVIDFEWSGLDAPVADLARLHLGAWAGRPDLRAAFLGGYGRQLSPAEDQMLRGCAVLTAVWLLDKARETHQPSFEDATRRSLLRVLSPAS